MTLITVYASIGNSDDKLTQLHWHYYASDFVAAIRLHAQQVHGQWYSLPNSCYQNACVCFVIDSEAVSDLRAELASVRIEYEQDSIAWAVAPETEFV